ncbi:MAG: four helix bundle protein [Acidobacteria bacterium]|nr:MAG: four helix bundle protein [Acidobacteriota bacterium]
MGTYKELHVWQKAVGLVTETYKATRAFPDEEKFGLTAQARRAAASIPANIAEGWGRGTTKEYVQFLIVARGSLLELETHLIVSRNLGFLEPADLDSLNKNIHEVGRLLNSLIRSLRSRKSSPSP